MRDPHAAQGVRSAANGRLLLARWSSAFAAASADPRRLRGPQEGPPSQLHPVQRPRTFKPPAALIQQQQEQQDSEGGPPGLSESAAYGVLPGAAEQSNSRSSRGAPSAGGGDSPGGPPCNPIEEALLPAKLLRERPSLFALELKDPELQQTAGAPLLSSEKLGLPHLRQVLKCLDSSHAEGVLLLLCERRSAAASGGPYRASLDTLTNATPAQLGERRQLLHQEQQQQPPLHDLGLGAVAGGLVTVAASGQRQLNFLFSVEELPDDARHQLVRVLVVRLMALAFVWPSVFWSSSLQSDDDLRVPAQVLLHFPRAARNFLCLPSGLQLSRHFETEEGVVFNHADQVRGYACVKRMQRKLQQQAGRARQDAKGSPSSSSFPQQQQQQQQEASPREVLPLPCSFEGLPTDWLEFWAILNAMLAVLVLRDRSASLPSPSGQCINDRERDRQRD
ncbi:hypothetical protein Esti_001824 [Eimeria stiedai]